MSSPSTRDGALAPGVALALALALGASLRLARAPLEPSTFDEVSFLTALHRWDLLAFEPHFPGYPLTVLLARAAAALGASAPYATVATALLVPAAAGAFVALGRTWGGAVAGGLLALAPLAVAEGARPMADATAMALLALGLVAAARAAALGGALRSFVAGVALGLAVAAKPDLALFLHAAPLAAWLAPGAGRGARVALALAGASGVLVLATIGLVEGAGGPAVLLHEATRFTQGHATQWGGGVVAAGAAPLGWTRPLLAVEPLVGVSSAPLLLLLATPLAILASRAPRALRRAAVLAVVPYGLWHVLGQNLEQPRHALPLLVPLAALVGAGIDRHRARAWIAVAVLVTAGLGAALTRRDDAFERLLAGLRQADRTSLRVYGGATIRPLRFRLADLDARRARDVDAARADLAADPCPPERAWILKEVPGSSELPIVLDAGAASLHVLVPGEPHGR